MASRSTAENRGERHASATLRRTARKVVAALKRKPNVLYVTVGTKRVKGKRTKHDAIVVYVAKKQKRLQKAHRVPKTVRSEKPSKNEPKRIRTDVVQIEQTPEAFGARAGQIIKSFDNDLGVCGLPFVKNGVGYVLTNAHVACDVNIGRYGEGTLLDSSTNLFFDLGPVVYWTPMSLNAPVSDDTAVLRADHWLVDPLMVLGANRPIASFGEVDEMQNATYWYNVNGAVFQCSHAEWVVGTAPISVDGRIFSYCRFWQLQMTVGVAAHGHSGALLCRSSGDDIIACGLVFGGVQPNYIFAFPIRALYQRAYERL